jgi:plasmid maintenance system antidote protein VapI
MFAVAVPNNIKTVLAEKNMTPYQLAKLWDKHPNHVYTLVNKDNLDETRAKTIVELARLLGVTVDRLITK